MHLVRACDTFDDMNNLRLLEFAIALDDHRSFVRAAEVMNVTQPTFSRSIAALEASLGARLFERSNRRVTPTRQGSMLLVRARQLIADAARMRDALDDYRELRSGRLAVGVGSYPLVVSVTECVVRLTTRHPGLQIEVIESNWREFGPRLLSGELEVAVMESSIVVMDSRFQVESLPAHAAFFYCRAGHPLMQRSGVTIQEILEYPFIGTRVPARVFASVKLHSPLVSIDPVTGDVIPHVAITSFAAAREIVKRTDGIGISTRSLVADDICKGTLAILDLQVSNLRSGYGVTWLRSRELSPAAQVFVATLKEVEAEVASGSTDTDDHVRTSRRGRNPRKR
jgi:DNA-binding transcriptional LysR family regulator